MWLWKRHPMRSSPLTEAQLLALQLRAEQREHEERLAKIEQEAQDTSRRLQRIDAQVRSYQRE